MAKQQSFAEKAAKKKKKNLSNYVKYIKSVKSEKTGHWRFNEQMIEVKEGENLDDALKRMDEVAQVFDMNIPVVETPADGNTIEKDETDGPEHEQASVGNGQEKLEDVVAEESAIEINEPVASEQTETKSELEPETDDTATTEDDQESSATEGEEPTVEKENDGDETEESVKEELGTVTEKQAENADTSAKDMPAKDDESA